MAKNLSRFEQTIKTVQRLVPGWTLEINVKIIFYAYQANQDTKVRFEVVKPFSHIPKPLPLKIAKKRISKHTNPLFCNSTSEERDRLKNAVQEFIERGGIITKYPDEIPLKEESVKIIERFTMDDSDSFSISEEINELINEHDNPNSSSQ